MKCECCGQEIRIVKHEWCELPSGGKIGKYCVTNLQYKEFTDETGYKTPYHWENGEIPKGLENHPVVHVSYWDAKAYCDWLSRSIGKEVDLPSGEQWLEAAGDKIYPWGNEYEESRLNSGESGFNGTVPVNDFRDGDSPIGCRQMSGNVWEWTKEVDDD